MESIFFDPFQFLPRWEVFLLLRCKNFIHLPFYLLSQKVFFLITDFIISFLD